MPKILLPTGRTRINSQQVTVYRREGDDRHFVRQTDLRTGGEHYVSLSASRMFKTPTSQWPLDPQLEALLRESYYDADPFILRSRQEQEQITERFLHGVIRQHAEYHRNS